MNSIVVFLMVTPLAFGGEALMNALSKGNVTRAGGAFSRQTVKSDSKQLESMQEIAGVKEQKIKGLSVKVAEVNVSKRGSISVEYSPKYQNTLGGAHIDNEENAAVKFNYHF